MFILFCHKLQKAIKRQKITSGSLYCERCSIWDPWAWYMQCLGQDESALLITFWCNVCHSVLKTLFRLKRLVTLRFCRGLLRMPQRLKSNGAASGDFGIHSTGVMNLTPCSCRYWRVFLPCERMHYPDKKSYRSFFKAGIVSEHHSSKKGSKRFRYRKTHLL